MPIRVKRIWAVFWMRHAGLGKFGRVASRFASWGVPPYVGRRKLASLNPKGYISHHATVHHAAFSTSNNVFIDDHVLIYQAKGGGRLVLSDNVSIYRYSILQTGQGGSLEIGASTAIQSHCNFSAYVGPIKIGQQVQIAPGCSFYSYNHGFAKGQSIYDQPLQSKGGILVENDAWLGVGVTVLDNVSIGKGAVIAAGAVVTTDIPDGAIAGGVPARIISMRK